MIRLHILAGMQAGSQVEARRFPFGIGRAPDTNLVLEDAGVWDQHFRIEFDPREGFLISPIGESLSSVNGQTVTKPTRLRNGDIIEAGASRLQFWLGESHQTGNRLRETLVWAGIALITLWQVLLIYQLTN